jgi:hypothetical protein
VRVVGRSDALVTRPCLDVDLFSEEELTPLRLRSTVSNKKKSRDFALSLGFADSEENLSFLGLPCQGFEEELLALSPAIEVSHFEQVSASFSKCGKKKVIES